MNKVVLIGRLTKDPDLRFIPGSGTAVTTFTIAVDRRFKKEGQPEADFIPVVVWGKIAENTANYMSKGRLIGISGRIQTRSYEAKDGTRRYVTEVVADEVQFLDYGNKQASNENENNNFDYGPDVTPVDDEDIPF
ncbi:single-stranded DNA-binding protein A [Clostridium tepidiprofundi DSM 19306]|uniref:Single-stranded DNA-binding protein n=1 Tax=Clostridium tepidiprofundi DSM 19306 TaxID=1121338 RepID=A0A151B802_9CLOT|nr:single-stranded DNA-binding protein [Clostridium tepidiprofundi]KYH35862.1 single-stranded DNA-binding protein A [Clostridium tepidiprofundi DSM 19306]